VRLSLSLLDVTFSLSRFGSALHSKKEKKSCKIKGNGNQAYIHYDAEEEGMVKRRVRRAVSPPSSTLFSAPAPSQSRSRLYSHGHSQPLIYVRGRSQSASKSPWTTDDSGEEDGSRSSSFPVQSPSSGDHGVSFDKIREPSHRRLHLQKVFDLLHLSIGRRDGIRAFRCLRILLKSHEWRPIELWRYALEVATLTGAHVDNGEAAEDNKEAMAWTDQERIARKRLALLRELSKARTGLVSCLLSLASILMLTLLIH